MGHKHSTDIFVDVETAQRLHALLQQANIPLTRAAAELGVSRGHLTQSLNGTKPLRRAYALALRFLLQQVLQTRARALARAEAQHRGEPLPDESADDE